MLTLNFMDFCILGCETGQTDDGENPLCKFVFMYSFNS